MASSTTSIAFAGLGVGTLLVISGIRGHTVGDVLNGRVTDTPIDPGGGKPGDFTPGDVGGPATITGGGDFTGVTTKVGLVTYDGVKVAAWIAPILKYARGKGWTGRVTSGYRSLAQQAAIYDRGVRPAAKPGTSNHEQYVYPGGAVDVTNPEQLSVILMKSPYKNVLVWAGAKDPVHFSHPHSGGY